MLYEDLGLNVAMVCCPVVMPWPWLDSAVGTSSPWKGFMDSCLSWIKSLHLIKQKYSRNQDVRALILK